MLEGTRRAVAKNFKQFLETYTLQAGKPPFYIERIKVRVIEYILSILYAYRYLLYHLVA